MVGLFVRLWVFSLFKLCWHQTHPVCNQHGIDPVHNFWWLFVSSVCLSVSLVKCEYKMNWLDFRKHCVGNVHHDNFQWEWTGAGWTDGTEEATFPVTCLENHRSRERGVRSREEHLLIFAFVSGRCNLSMDAGTRVHLLDAKGLSFTQNVSSVFIIVCNIFAFGGQHSKIQFLIMSWKYLFCPSGHTAFCESVWTSPPPCLDSDKLTESVDLQV